MFRSFSLIATEIVPDVLGPNDDVRRVGKIASGYVPVHWQRILARYGRNATALSTPMAMECGVAVLDIKGKEYDHFTPLSQPQSAQVGGAMEIELTTSTSPEQHRADTRCFLGKKSVTVPMRPTAKWPTTLAEIVWTKQRDGSEAKTLFVVLRSFRTIS
jgi:hypothetical protein